VVHEFTGDKIINVQEMLDESWLVLAHIMISKKDYHIYKWGAK